MHCAKNCSVTCGFTDNGDILLEIVKINVTKNSFAEFCGNSFHFASYCSIFVSEVSVVSACVNDAKSVVAGCEIKSNLVDNGNCGILEINLNEAAYRTSHLIHKTAGLTEIFVLCKLCNLCDFNCTYLAVVIEVIKDCAEKNFECC